MVVCPPNTRCPPLCLSVVPGDLSYHKAKFKAAISKLAVTCGLMVLVVDWHVDKGCTRKDAVGAMDRVFRYQWAGKWEDAGRGARHGRAQHGEGAAYAGQLEPPAEAWSPGDGGYGLGLREVRQDGHKRGPLARREEGEGGGGSLGRSQGAIAAAESST